MLLGGLKFDLLVHFGLSVAITVLLLIRYGDQTSVDNFDWNHTLSGTAAIISLVHSVISGLNLAKDVLWTGEKCENKKKLNSGLWNFGRNLFTGLLMVLIGMLFGFNSSDEELIAPLVLIALVRLSDSPLDCENILAVQCTSKDEPLVDREPLNASSDGDPEDKGRHRARHKEPDIPRLAPERVV